MSVHSAYGSKGWEFESLRARLGNLKIHTQLREAVQVEFLTGAAFLCLFLCLLQLQRGLI